jgi:hypothetical protein
VGRKSCGCLVRLELLDTSISYVHFRDALVDSIVSCCVPDMIGVYLKACEVRLLAVMVLLI